MNLQKLKSNAWSQIEEFIFQDFLCRNNQDENFQNSPDFVFVYENDNKTDGTFLIHTLLSSYLKQDFGVCFVSLTQSFSHYNSVSQKLGVDLKSMRDSEQFIFFDGLKLMGNTILNENTNESESDFESLMKDNSLFELFNTIRTLVDKLSKDRREVTVIIDNISVLMSIGVSVKQIVAFCHSLERYLLQTQFGPVIMLSNNYGDDDDECISLVKFLIHLSTVSIQISSLPSGYCKDVHGQMKILKRNRLGRNKRIEKTVHFKVNDKSVNLFAVGLSSAVL